MTAYIRHMLAVLAALFGSHASVSNQAGAQDPAERQAWETADAQGTKQAYEIYLSEYPIGAYSREAFAKIVQLSSESPGDTPRNIEEISEGDVFSIQTSGSNGGVQDLY